MTDQHIKTRPDGSIDTAHYMRIGRRMRGEAAMEMLRGPKAAPRSRATLRTSPRGMSGLVRRLFGALQQTYAPRNI